MINEALKSSSEGGGHFLNQTNYTSCGFTVFGSDVTLIQETLKGYLIIPLPITLVSFSFWVQALQCCKDSQSL